MKLQQNLLDGGSSSAQMTDFFGWKNPNMCQEYVSTSKPAITNMAKKRAGHIKTVNMDDPKEEVEVAREMEKKLESDEFMFLLEEGPDM